MRPREHAQFGIVDLLEPVGDRVAQLGRRRVAPCQRGQSAQRVFDDVPARVADPVPPILVARLIGPEIARIILDRGDDLGGRMRFEPVGEFGDDALPLVRRLAERRKDRVVEIEQDRGREIGHWCKILGGADDDQPSGTWH